MNSFSPLVVVKKNFVTYALPRGRKFERDMGVVVEICHDITVDPNITQKFELARPADFMAKRFLNRDANSF